jgi:hypothetical protein
MATHDETSSLLVELAPQDARALDAFIESRSLGPRLTSTGPLPEIEPERAERIDALMELIGQCPVADAPDDLVRGTLQRIKRRRSMDMDATRLRGHGRGVGMPVRLREIMAVAAMLIVGVSLVLPVLARTRHEALRIACQARLGIVGKAFTQYAANNNGHLPRRYAAPNSRWFNVGWTLSEDGPAKANSANLYLLARGRYVDPATLACPARQGPQQHMTAEMHDWPTLEAVPYSYQNQYAAQASRLENLRPHMAVLADKNPRFVVRNGVNLQHVERMPMHASSRSHRRQGQNVLFVDGAVKWCSSPIMPDGDNIWLARGIDRYDGTEVPTGPNDAFLVP